MALFSPALLGFPKGTPGALGVAIAIFAALGGGGPAGAVVALAGWISLFLSQQAASTLIALPVWVATAYVVGILSEALLTTQHALTEREIDRIASHELRTPLATIVGLARVLRAGQLPEREERLVDTIEQEASGMLERFDRRRTNGGEGGGRRRHDPPARPGDPAKGSP
ncbi:MAG: hypothetical protein M3M94_05655 [Actinomycetota bacterium]|nr:hypothetical protein [Actinomycetota bacterium]